MVEGLGVFPLFEMVFAHRHVGHMGHECALVVAGHRLEHAETALMLIHVEQFNGLVVEPPCVAVDIGCRSGPLSRRGRDGGGAGCQGGQQNDS